MAAVLLLALQPACAGGCDPDRAGERSAGGGGPVAGGTSPAGSGRTAAGLPREPERTAGRSAAGASPIAFPGAEWETATPEAAGLDPGRLAGAVAAVRGMAGVRSLLVVRRGRLVVERYDHGGGPGRAENLKSASKSLLSGLVGIALERGLIDDLDQPVAALLPGAFEGVSEPSKRRITLRHLLTMTAGLGSTSGEHYSAWVSQPDWVAAALARPAVAPPGERFVYSTGNSHLVSAILTRATGEPTLDFMREALLEPIGAGVAGWSRSPRGIYFGGNDLTMTPRDLARFGLLYLAGGRWDGRPVVPEGWVEESTRRHSEGWPDRYGGYGHLWWVRLGERVYMAVGYGGQFLWVAPEAGLVAVVTSTLEGKGAAWDRELLRTLHDGLAGAARGD